MEERRWWVLHVNANHEKQVARHLAVRSVEYYLPLYTERSKWSDRVVTLERPLFAGYVFVRFAPNARIAVISVPGVLRLLGDRSCDTVSTEEVQRIQAALGNGCSLRPDSIPTLGTHVRVSSGVFAGVEGMVSEFRQRCKVVIALSATQRAFSLELDRTALEVLPPPFKADLPNGRRLALR